MKKILAAVLAVTLLVASLAGCSSSQGDKGELVLYTWEGMFLRRYWTVTREDGTSDQLRQL